MRRPRRRNYVGIVYNNLLFWPAYLLSWLFWQAGGKQVRRAIMRSYDDIEKRDAARSAREALDETVCWVHFEKLPCRTCLREGDRSENRQRRCP